MANLQKYLIKLKRSKSGFSLIEALVTVVLFMIILGACYMVLLSGTDSWQVGHVKVEMRQDLRKAMEWLKMDLQQAGSSSVIDVPADGNSYSTITFRISDGVQSGNIKWFTNPIQYVLGGSNTDQLQRIQGSQTRVVAQNIASIVFTRQSSSPNIVEVGIKTQAASIMGHETEDTISFNIEMRNE